MNISSKPEYRLWPESLLRQWGVLGEDTPSDPAHLARQLALPVGVAEHLTAVYSPLAERLTRRLPLQNEPKILGINGAQGTGKSTAAEVLAYLLAVRGFKVCCLSIDDLYLTLAEREQLAASVHPLLRTRGVPGTHDVALGLRLLEQLKAAEADTKVRIPRFDKALDDRCAPEDFDVWEGRPHLIIFEGWCLGAKPQDRAALEVPANELERREDAGGGWRRYVNEQLQAYQALFDQLDYLIMLKAPSFEQVYEWRAEQEQALEQKMAAQGRAASHLMSAEGLRRFIQHYERLTRWILEEMPQRADLLLELSPAHRIQRITAHQGERL